VTRKNYEILFRGAPVIGPSICGEGRSKERSTFPSFLLLSRIQEGEGVFLTGKEPIAA
jgi:hypothetical protein